MIKQLLPWCLLAVACCAAEAAAAPETIGTSETELSWYIQNLDQKAVYGDAAGVRDTCRTYRESCAKKLAWWQKNLAEFQENKAKLKLLEISKVQPAQYDSATWGISFDVTNRTDKIITRIELEARLMLPGRKIPWAKNSEIGWNLAGGLNPGETRSCVLWPAEERKLYSNLSGDTLWGALSGGWVFSREQKGHIVVRVTAAYDDSYDMFADPEAEGGEPLWALGTDEDEQELNDNIAKEHKAIDAIERYLEQFELRLKAEGKSAKPEK